MTWGKALLAREPGPELLTTEEMARADRLAIGAGTPGVDLMEAAGRAVAAAVAELTAAGASVAVLCGPGNNGGDGLCAARLLREQGYAVGVGLLGPPDALGGDSAVMAARWGGEMQPLSPESVASADVIVDALFGAGLSRPLDGVAAAMVAAVNASGKPVVAVDVPSGLDGATGRAAGPVVQATRTVTNGAGTITDHDVTDIVVACETRTLGRRDAAAVS